MRGLPLVIVLVAAVAAVLGLSVRNLGRERDRLLRDFADDQMAVAGDAASELQNRFQDLVEDGQLIANLVRSARMTPDLDAETRHHVIRAGLNALAAGVRHYRHIALFPTGGSPPVIAVDPAEDTSARGSLLVASKAVAMARPTHEKETLSGPTTSPGGRSIYLYRVPVDEGVVVIVVDAPRLLHTALRSPPDRRMLAIDSSANLWKGCGGQGRCTAVPSERAADIIEAVQPTLGVRTTTWPEERFAKAFDLPQGAFVVASERATGPAGDWRVLVATTAQGLHQRERALFRQLILSTAGLLLTVGLVGAFIVRQQRRAAALAERLQHAEAIRRMEAQLIRAEKLASTGVLAAGIAHEVGTPLGIIRGRAELLLEQLGDSPAARGLHAIIHQIDRISSTIRQVLDFASSQPVQRQPVLFHESLKAILDLLAHRIRHQHLVVEVNVSSELPPLAADPDQLQQVLINVLLNACDAMSTGGRLTVSATETADGRCLKCEILDDGCGIDPEHLHAVFDPFFTTKKRGQGTGLGLPVAASIVRNHGGEIALAGAQPKGTVVAILWPCAATPEQRHA